MLTQQHWFEICPTCKVEFRFYICAPPLERMRAVITFQKAYISHYDVCKKNSKLIKVSSIHRNRVKQYLNEE